MAMALTAEASIKGRQCFWGAPTYDQCRIGWDELRKAASQVARFNESRMEVQFPNGGKTRFRSLDDPDNARGFTADLWVIEEASYVQGRAYTEVIRPTVMNTGGEIWSIYTPNGYDWTHEQEIKAIHNPESAVFVAPTRGAQFLDDGRLVPCPHPLENPDIPWSELESMAAEMGEMRFRQEILAERTARAGRVFGAFSRARHVRAVPYDANLPVSLGLDFGYRTLSFAAVQDEKSTATMRVFAEGEWHEVSTGQAIARIKAWHPWWPKIAYIDCDPAGDGTNLQTLMSDVYMLRREFPQARVRIDYNAKNHKPETRAGFLRDRLLTVDGTVRLFVDESCVNVIRMFEESVYPEHKQGQPEKPEPLKDGVNDHMRDALGYHEVQQYHTYGAKAVA